MLFGYDQGLFGGILTNEAFLDQFNHASPTLQGQIVALYNVGCMLGCVVNMKTGDILGRKRSILLGCSIVIVGAVIQTASYGVAQMISGRVFGGIGTGILTTSIPIWQVETASAKHRGAAIVFQLVAVIFGGALASWMNYGFTFLPGPEVGWRFPIAFQVFVAVITISLVSLLPESPRWPIQRDRTEEAAVVISRLRAKQRYDPVVLAEVSMVSEAVNAERAQQTGITFREVFQGGSKQTLRRLLRGMGTQFMQQTGETNVVATYMPVVLTQSFNMSARLALVLSATVSHWLMIWAALCSLVIDSVGRRRLMLWGTFAMSICFALIACGLAVDSAASLITAIAFIYLYYIAYGLSLLSIPFLYAAEFNSQRFQNLGPSLATLTNWTTCYIVVSVTPPGIASIGWKYYMIYAITNAAFVPLVYFFYPETARLSLEEINDVIAPKHGGDHSISYKQATKDAVAARVSPEEEAVKFKLDGDVDMIEFAPEEKS
ncbi:MFS-type transporter oryC [Fulvia fulva]|nr:MFS-type transporter oryC [Fulvia fulva]KAK4630646.1 MFS-type transporter oryC [Fulvia fulva]WPV27460.1 MFS-type transporter oryC [Fulvia fulva]